MLYFYLSVEDECKKSSVYYSTLCYCVVGGCLEALLSGPSYSFDSRGILVTMLSYQPLASQYLVSFCIKVVALKNNDNHRRKKHGEYGAIYMSSQHMYMIELVNLRRLS